MSYFKLIFQTDFHNDWNLFFMSIIVFFFVLIHRFSIEMDFFQISKESDFLITNNKTNNKLYKTLKRKFNLHIVNFQCSNKLCFTLKQVLFAFVIVKGFHFPNIFLSFQRNSINQSIPVNELINNNFIQIKSVNVRICKCIDFPIWMLGTWFSLKWHLQDTQPSQTTLFSLNFKEGTPFVDMQNVLHNIRFFFVLNKINYIYIDIDRYPFLKRKKLILFSPADCPMYSNLS